MKNRQITTLLLLVFTVFKFISSNILYNEDINYPKEVEGEVYVEFIRYGTQDKVITHKAIIVDGLIFLHACVDFPDEKIG